MRGNRFFNCAYFGSRVRIKLSAKDIVLLAFRGGIVGLFLGVGIRILRFRFLPVKLGFQFSHILGIFIILAIPFLWITILENKEDIFVGYQDKIIVNPYLTLFSMEYFMVNLTLIIPWLKY